jgi:hypothetical protein
MIEYMDNGRFLHGGIHRRHGTRFRVEKTRSLALRG